MCTVTINQDVRAYHENYKHLAKMSLIVTAVCESGYQAEVLCTGNAFFKANGIGHEKNSLAGMSYTLDSSLLLPADIADKVLYIKKYELCSISIADIAAIPSERMNALYDRIKLRGVGSFQEVANGNQVVTVKILTSKGTCHYKASYHVVVVSSTNGLGAGEERDYDMRYYRDTTWTQVEEATDNE